MAGLLLVADVVASCPPLFDARRDGCHVSSSLAGTVTCGLLFLAVAVAVAVGRRRSRAVPWRWVGLVAVVLSLGAVGWTCTNS